LLFAAPEDVVEEIGEGEKGELH